MQRFFWSVFGMSILCCFVAAQTPVKVGTSTITGKITIENQPIAGVNVVLHSGDNPNPMKDEKRQRVTTDAVGNYRFERLVAGKYRVEVSAPGYVSKQKNENRWERGSLINVVDNETIDKLDFNLIRGGVITGRLMEESGKPITELNLQLERINEKGEKVPFGTAEITDDRGIYRCYGLEPGKYLVSAGQNESAASLNLGGPKYKKTWYPGVPDQAKAQIVEVTIENEAINIDFRLPRMKKGFTVSGRVIEEATGKPVKGVGVGLSTLDEKGQITGMSFGGSFTNDEGEFKQSGLVPGKYMTNVFPITGNSDGFAKPLKFELKDEDYSNLEIKMVDGVSIGGFAVLEGVDDPAIKQAFQGLTLQAFAQSAPQEMDSDFSFNSPGKIEADGRFLLRGLRAGKIQIMLNTFGTPNLKNFSLSRIERDSVPVEGGIEAKSGEKITGVRLVVAYAAGRLSGQVTLVNAPSLSEYRIMASVSQTEKPANNKGVSVDERGRFLIEGLAAGVYELKVNAFPMKPGTVNTAELPSVTQTVTIPHNNEAKVSLTLDFKGKGN
jgi:5-hydroxyisourate hydrolase-like protein (transthyretin family)